MTTEAKANPNPPKHQQIYEQMHERIRSGRFRPGERIPTDVELVKEFGVSRPTVARALRDLERRGLLLRRPGSGTYVQKAEAGALQFGLLIPGLGRTEIFEPICGQIARFAHQKQHSLLWGSTDLGDDTQAENLAGCAMNLCGQFIENHVTGVFFAPFVVASNSDQINRMIVDRLDEAGIAIVLLDRDYVPYPQRSTHDLVGIDNRRAGFMITAHLLEQGCERVSFIAHPFKVSTIEARVAGYIEALEHYGLPVGRDRVHYCDPEDAQLIQKILDQDKPDGIICGNDAAAGQLMHSLDDIGVDVPGDVLVAGMDDVKYAKLLRVPLTTVHQPCSAIGQAAFLTMLERMEWPEAPARDVLLSCHLVARESTSRA